MGSRRQRKLAKKFLQLLQENDGFTYTLKHRKNKPIVYTIHNNAIFTNYNDSNAVYIMGADTVLDWSEGAIKEETEYIKRALRKAKKKSA